MENILDLLNMNKLLNLQVLKLPPSVQLPNNFVINLAKFLYAIQFKISTIISFNK
jgi:hypothetical protein